MLWCVDASCAVGSLRKWLFKKNEACIYVDVHEIFGFVYRVDSFDILMMRVEKHDILR